MHTITITELATNSKVAVARGSGNAIYGIAFNDSPIPPPKDPSMRTHRTEIVQVGEKHSKFSRHVGSSIEVATAEGFKPTETARGVTFMHDGTAVLCQDNGTLAQMLCVLSRLHCLPSPRSGLSDSERSSYPLQ